MTDTTYLLIFNAGSSSLKFGVFDCSDELSSRLRGAVRDIGRSKSVLVAGDTVGEIDGVATVSDAAAIILDQLTDGTHEIRLSRENVAATGHRVVHGGAKFTATTRLDSASLEQLTAIDHLAPLHNPYAMAVMQAVENRFPGVPTVAEFDTAFFHDLPESARSYAIPFELSERYAIRRYGFHGIAHQYMSMQVGSLNGKSGTPSRVVSLHLGQGCSIAALRDGRAVETSMGFTPLEGLIMGTRSGDIDAGVLLYLARQGHTWRDLEDVLNRRSGLLGLSGESDDMRRLLELESQGHAGSRLAVAAFCHRINKYLGAYAAVLGGIDTLLIGGGIGENSPIVRARICSQSSWLGLKLDADANEKSVGGVRRISSRSSAVDVRVVPVDEEWMIARSTWALHNDQG